MHTSSNHVPALALRFEVIRRLAPGFRHRMLGRMQPIALLSHLMGKKIQAGQTDDSFLLTRLNELKGSITAATNATVGLFSWLDPDDRSEQPLNDIVEECLDLLKMEIYNSNVSFHNTIDTQALVKASKVRQVFSACVLTYIDTTEHASQVTLTAKQVTGKIVIEMVIWPGDGENKALNEAATFVNWEAIQLISDGVEIVKTDDQVILSNLT